MVLERAGTRVSSGTTWNIRQRSALAKAPPASPDEGDPEDGKTQVRGVSIQPSRPACRKAALRSRS